jgi:hypothetical protein
MLNGCILERPSEGRYTKESGERVYIMFVVFRFTMCVFSIVWFFSLQLFVTHPKLKLDL